MKIVVIDNFDWITAGAAFYTEKPDIVDTSSSTFEEVIEYLSYLRDDKTDQIYLINVHCVFNVGKSKRKYNFQQQNGVAIYRHLLNIYEDNQEKLKVAFFSPITVEDLIKLNSENAILEHHPFFYVPFNWNNCIAELQSKTDWKYFNNASENLLSGWSFNGRTKIYSTGKNIVVIDDQIAEWKAVFDTVFDNPRSLYYALYQKNEAPNNEFSLKKIIDPNFRTKVHQADLIMSDFYLQESHEADIWKTFGQLENISGYRLYKQIIENINGGIPVLIHSSSNKVRYYQFLDRSGIDDWSAKDIRLDVPNPQKQFNYECIKNSIERFMVGEHAEIYEHLKDFWRRIEKLKNLNTANWWYSNKDNRENANDKRATKTEKKYIIDILTDAYFAIRAYLKREDLLAKSFSSKDNNFTASAIISNLGNIYELLGYSQKSADLTGLNLHLRFFFATRNAASHYASYRYLSIEDALIYFHYWLLALEDVETNASTKFAVDGQFHIEQPEKSKFRMLYIWIQFYNSSNRPKTIPEKFEKRINERMQEILNSIDHAELYIELYREGPTRGQVVGNWTDGNQFFKLAPEGKNGKLKLSNA